MWYEGKMVSETLDSLQQALEAAPNVSVKLAFCINLQTYIEKPSKGSVIENINPFIEHPVFKRKDVLVYYKKDKDDFYNIADWRREAYEKDFKYTVWGESDCLLPRDFFYVLSALQVSVPHILCFASRPMWDNTWDKVTHKKLQGFSKPCQCPKDNHREDCLELLEAPYKYKDYITQEQLNDYNDKSGDIDIVGLDDLKIDGSLLCLSGGLPAPFIAPGMSFVREDSCAENFFRIKKVPQFCVKSRLKGHNYWHPLKRTNTDATRNDKVFKEYADRSAQAMNEFLYKTQQDEMATTTS